MLNITATKLLQPRRQEDPLALEERFHITLIQGLFFNTQFRAVATTTLQIGYIYNLIKNFKNCIN